MDGKAAPMTTTMELSSRILSSSISRCVVQLWTRDGTAVVEALELQLTFPQQEIQPLFSGACWAGTVVWPASLLLCDFIDTLDVKGKVVLELGAGVGVPGMAASILGAKQVLITEQPPLGDLLVKNIDINFIAKHGRNRNSIIAADLDWNDPSLPEGFDSPIDIILVSDCVYEQLYGDSWKALATSLFKLSTPNRTKIYNSMERRTEDGIDKFLDYASKLGLQSRLLKQGTTANNEELVLYEMVVVDQIELEDGANSQSI